MFNYNKFMPLLNRFDAIVSADAFEYLKPAPDIFIAASKLLNVPSDEVQRLGTFFFFPFSFPFSFSISLSLLPEALMCKAIQFHFFILIGIKDLLYSACKMLLGVQDFHYITMFYFMICMPISLLTRNKLINEMKKRLLFKRYKLQNKTKQEHNNYTQRVQSKEHLGND